jgi:hypothetical protein
MAVGTVSSISDDTWQLISTTTMAGATSYTLSSIAGYKRLMVAVTNGVKSASGAYWTVRYNGDTTGGKYSGGGGTRSFHYIGDDQSISSACLVIVEDADKSVPHFVYIGGYGDTSQVSVGYLDPTPITSITIGTHTGSPTLNSGTIRLYGIAA